MNNYWAFAPMIDSSPLLGDSDALQERMDRDGYLLIRGLVDRDRLAPVHQDFLQILASEGWIADGDALAEMRPVRTLMREGEDDFFAAYDQVQKLESFHTLAHDERLHGAVREIVGTSAFPHPLKVARLVFPGAPAVSTPPHQDFLNNQGTAELMATWIPLHDCPMQTGTIAILRGSHRYGVLPLEWHLGPGNRQAVMPEEMQEKLRWVTTDMNAGDVLFFGSMTVHAALNNASFGMRLSVDFRYQEQGQELSDLVLKPHFERLSWDEIYAGWQSEEFQYYWRDLDYELVPYNKTPFEESAPSEEQMIRAVVYEQYRQKAL